MDVTVTFRRDARLPTTASFPSKQSCSYNYERQFQHSALRVKAHSLARLPVQVIALEASQQQSLTT